MAASVRLSSALVASSSTSTAGSRSNVRAIDGPTVYSAFPSNVSAKLPPKDPDGVSARLSAAIRAADIPAALRDSFVAGIPQPLDAARVADLQRLLVLTGSDPARLMPAALFQSAP